MLDRKFLSVKDMASYLGIVPMTVYRMVDRGDLSCYRVGNRLKFTPDQLKEYLDRNEFNANKDGENDTS